jgi:hypothetical protein
MSNMIKPLNKQKEEGPCVADLTAGFYRIPFAELGPKNYEIPNRLFAFEKELEEYEKKLFEGKIDAGNGDACDKIIDDELDLAKEEIKMQKASHISLIKDLLRRWVGDHAEAEQRLAYIKEELQSTDEEIIRTKNLIDEHNLKRGIKLKPADARL